MTLFRQFKQKLEQVGLAAALAWVETLPPAQQAMLRTEIDLYQEIYSFVAAQCAARLGPGMDAARLFGSLQAAADGAMEAVFDLERVLQHGSSLEDITDRYHQRATTEDIISNPD